MANPHRGEVSVDVGGISYTLASSINATIEVEAMFSKAEGRKVTWKEILERFNDGSMEHKRAIFWSTLRKYHPAVTLEQAGDLSDALDLQFAGNKALEEAVQASAPDQADVQELQIDRPRKAQPRKRTNGTGANSTSRPASSV